MTTFTMRYVKGHFVLTGPDVPPMQFKSRAEARDWCTEHYPGSRSRRALPSVPALHLNRRLSPDDPLTKPREKAPGERKLARGINLSSAT